MPLSAPPTPPTPGTPWNRDPRRRERAYAHGRCAHRGPRLFSLAALVLLLASVAAGVAIFAATNGLPASPVYVSAPGDAAGSLAAHQHSRLAPVPVSPGTEASSVCLSGNRDTVGGSLTIGAGEWVCGNVSVYGGSVTIFGHVNGNVTVVGGSADVSGQVDGNLTTIGGGIDLRPGAAIGGNVDAIGGGITRGAGVTVGGNVEHGFAGHDVPTHWFGLFGGASFPWFHVLFWALAGLCVAAFFPAPLRRVRDVVRREPAMSFLGGLAALFFGIIAALVLFITCLGIPIALLLVLGLWLAWIVGTVALGYWIGEGLLRMGAAHDRPPVVATVLGVTLLSLFESIPCAGGVISLVAGFMGLGATTLALLYSRRGTGRRARII